MKVHTLAFSEGWCVVEGFIVSFLHSTCISVSKVMTELRTPVGDEARKHQSSAVGLDHAPKR